MTTPTPSRALVLNLALVGVVPRIWRRLTVPPDLSLLDLHHAIQIVMGWRDVHLHVFEIHDREYGPRPEEEWEREQWAGDDGAITITKALTLADGSLDYIYDLGDDWRIRIEGIGAATSEAAASVTCVAGERAGPPEDCGGPVIYQELLDAWGDGSRRPSGSHAPSGFDPSAFDLDAVNTRLRRAFRPKATPDRPAGAHASEQQQRLATLTLATLVLGARRGKHGQREASKTMRVEILDALQEADLIYTDPKRRTVVITDAGLAQAQAFLDSLPPARRSDDD
jgi:Plasmid pRiA4b ORF-3-like protein